MTMGPNLDDLLPVETVDAGCAVSFEILHAYVDQELAGGQPARSQPGLAAHLRSCPACSADYEGLRDAAELYGDVGPVAL